MREKWTLAALVTPANLGDTLKMKRTHWSFGRQKNTKVARRKKCCSATGSSIVCSYMPIFAVIKNEERASVKGTSRNEQVKRTERDKRSLYSFQKGRSKKRIKGTNVPTVDSCWISFIFNITLVPAICWWPCCCCGCCWACMAAMVFPTRNGCTSYGGERRRNCRAARCDVLGEPRPGLPNSWANALTSNLWADTLDTHR